MNIAHIGDNYPLPSRDNRPLNRPKQGEYYPHMMRDFRTALIERCEKTGISLKRVAELSGVSYEQLKKLRQGKTARTNLEDALLIVDKAFGMTVDEFMRDPAEDGQPDPREALIQSQAELVELYNRLSPAEREFFQRSLKGVADQRQDQSQESHE